MIFLVLNINQCSKNQNNVACGGNVYGYCKQTPSKVLDMFLNINLLYELVDGIPIFDSTHFVSSKIPFSCEYGV